MAEVALQLLNSSQRQGQAWAQSVQQTLGEATRLNQQQQQFDKQLAVRASEFTAEMSYREAELAERQRTNNMQAERWMFMDELAAKKFGAEMALEPIRLETAKIGLEAQKISKERALQQNRDDIFNSITKPFDTQAAALLSGSRSEEFGNGYLTLKSKYQSEVAMGLPFDEAGFRKEYEELSGQYTDVVPNKEYNPALATMLDSMGATNEANRMRAENPVFSGSITGLKAGALTGGRQAFEATLGKYGSFLGNDEEVAAFSMNADAYFGLGDTIMSKTRELDTLNRAIVTSKNPEEKERIEQDINQLRGEISQARTQRSALYKRAIGVQTAENKTESVIDPDAKAREATARAIAQIEATRKVTPDAPASQFDKDSDLKTKRAAINSFIVNFPEALGDPSGENIAAGSVFNFKEWQNHSRDLTTSPSHVKILRNHILKNLNGIPTNDREASEIRSVAQGLGVETQSVKTLEQLITSPQFAEIFTNIKKRAVAVPKISSSLTSEGNAVSYIGDRSAGQFLIGNGLFGYNGSGFDTGLTEIESMDDVRDVLKNFEGTDEQKRIFMEKLYASVVAAGAINAFSLPE